MGSGDGKTSTSQPRRSNSSVSRIEVRAEAGASGRTLGDLRIA
jgi:hypothetical protein